MNEQQITVETKMLDGFSGTITSMANKYSISLTEIDRPLTASEKTLAVMIGNLTGSSYDISGLEDFQK